MATTGRRETDSGIEIRPVYTAADAPAERELPGVEPFTRGPYADMYRGRPWTIRQYAGFASAEESNERYRFLLARGQTGLSIAFDLPTQLGYDSDDPRAAGQAGRTRDAIDLVGDRWAWGAQGSSGVATVPLNAMRVLLDGTPLDEVATTRPINAPPPVRLPL